MDVNLCPQFSWKVKHPPPLPDRMYVICSILIFEYYVEFAISQTLLFGRKWSRFEV